MDSAKPSELTSVIVSEIPRGQKCHICRIIATVDGELACGKWMLMLGGERVHLCTWHEYQESAKACATCSNMVDRFRNGRGGSNYCPECRIGLLYPLQQVTAIGIGPLRDCSHKYIYNSIELLTTRRYTGSLPPPQYIPAEGLINTSSIRAWIDNCDTNHDCRQKDLYALYRLKSTRPALLVDLTQNCLVDVTKLNHTDLQYVCLSYVWGHKNPSPFTTTTNNLQKLLIPNSLELHETEIPQTIADAITVTRRLGLRYLWVDRLCIVQNDDEIVLREVSLMAAIYASSYFTLIVAAGSDDEHGITGVETCRDFSQDLLSFDGQHLAVHGAETESPWGVHHDRAWTYQERLLSQRRLLFYGKHPTFEWQCSQSRQHELIKDLSLYDLSLRVDPWPNFGQYESCLRDYTSRKLTYPSDALNAFSAILQALEPAFPGGFLFGIPEFYFSIGLLWQPEATGSEHVRRKEFPSWAWAGWEGSPDANASLLSSFETKQGFIGPRKLGYAIAVPMTTWYKTELGSTSLLPIDDSFHHWQKYLNPSEALPPGWRRAIPFRDKGESYYDVCVHETLDATDSREEFPHPVPIQIKFDTSRTTGDKKWSPYIRGKVEIVKLRIGAKATSGWEGWYSHSLYADHVLCGALSTNTLSANEPLEDAVFEFIAILRSTDLMRSAGRDGTDSWSRPHFNLDKKSPVEIIATVRALCIRWENGIAYRVGTGQILADIWDGLEKREQEIMLG